MTRCSSYMSNAVVLKPMLFVACRQVTEGDNVITGLARNNILQRFKLNGQTALITGAFVHRVEDSFASRYAVPLM